MWLDLCRKKHKDIIEPQNRLNGLVIAMVIAQMYEHFILANTLCKMDSMKATILQDMFAYVSPSKCKYAKKLIMDWLLCGMKNEYTRVFLLSTRAS